MKKAIVVLIIILSFAFSCLSQSNDTEQKVKFQIHNIIKAINCQSNFVIAITSDQEIKIIIGRADSLIVVSYENCISGLCNVYLISNSDNPDFKKRVNTFVSRIKTNHQYEDYSERSLTFHDFSLSFCVNNKIRSFNYDSANPDQQNNLEDVRRTIDAYLIMPHDRPNPRITVIPINNWRRLVKYLEKDR
jgi:hypothetical protein